MTDRTELHPDGKADLATDAAPASATSGYGYCRTPEESHWKKGCPSPNPKGRPPGRKNDKTLVRDIFENELVPAKIDGKNKLVSKYELSLRQIANKAAAGDLKAYDRADALRARHADPEAEEITDEEHAFHRKTVSDRIAFLQKFMRDDANEQA